MWSSADQGIQIDFSRMMGKRYDAAIETGFIEPGNRWRDSCAFFERFGRSPIGARLGGVGSGALLGGGMSYLSGRYGLGCDNFVKLDVVLPDGSLVQATRTNQYKDLFVSSFHSVQLHSYKQACADLSHLYLVQPTAGASRRRQWLRRCGRLPRQSAPSLDIHRWKPLLLSRAVRSHRERDS